MHSSFIDNKICVLEQKVINSAQNTENLDQYSFINQGQWQ